jgi:hypothetical protein
LEIPVFNQSESLPTDSLSRRAFFAQGASWGIGSLTLVGCGQQVYEQRLAETSAMFSHLQTLGEHLSGEWSDGVAAVRLPKQYQQIAPPAPLPPGATPGTTVLDPRQPDFVNVEFPGLRAAFQAQFGVAEEGAADTKTILGHVYVLSNHYLGAAPPKKPAGAAAEGDKPVEEKLKPGDYAAHVLRLLADGLQTTVQPGPTFNDWPRETFPRNHAALFPTGGKNPFAQVEVRSATMTARVRDLPSELSAFILSEGEAQLMLIFVTPRDVLPSEQYLLRRDYCLETLRLLQASLGAAATDPTGGGGGAPAGGAGLAL